MFGIGYSAFIGWFSRLPQTPPVTLFAWHQPSGGIYHVASLETIRNHRHAMLAKASLVRGDWKRGERVKLPTSELVMVAEAEARQYASIGEWEAEHQPATAAACVAILALCVGLAGCGESYPYEPSLEYDLSAAEINAVYDRDAEALRGLHESGDLTEDELQAQLDELDALRTDALSD